MTVNIPPVGSQWTTFATVEVFTVKYADDKVVVAEQSMSKLTVRVPWERWTEWYKKYDADNGAVQIG